MPRRKRSARRASYGRDPWDEPTAPWSDIDDDDEVWGQQAAPAAVLATLEPTQAAHLARVLAQFEPQTRARGERYAATGRVLRLAPTDVGFVATVMGSEPYEAVWAWFDAEWEAVCDCPVGVDCKHAYAAARAVLGAAPVAAAPASAPLAERLRLTPERWRREQQVAPLLRHLPAHIALHIAQAQIFDETDPDLLCWRLAQEIVARGGALPRALAPYRERPELAAALAASQREELVGDLVQWAERRRAAPSRRLRVVCSLERSAGEPAVGLEARVTSPRLADAPRTAAQLQQLRNELVHTPDALTADEAAALRLLTDGNPGYARMLHGHRTYLGGRALAALARRLAGTPIASWGDELDAELAARAGVVAGAPLRVSDAEARLLPVCVPHGDATAVELAYVWPDGTQRPFAAALRLSFDLPWSTTHEPPMVLADGVLSPLGEAPAAHIVARFAAAGGLLVTGEERARLVGTLAAAFPHLRPTLAAHTRAYDAQPLVALDLRADDWLQIRLLAHPRSAPWTPGAALDGGHEYVPPGRWRRPGATPPAPPDAAPPDTALGLLGEAPAAAVAPADAPADAAADAPDDDIWIEAPNADDVAPAIAWLAALPASAGGVGRPGGHAPTAVDREVGWWLRAAPRTMEALAAAWSARPAGVTYAGNRRMQRLLLGDETWQPRVRITASGLDWFAVSADWAREGEVLSEADLAALRGAQTAFVRLSGGWVRREAAQAHDAMADLLADLGVEIGAEPQPLSLWQLAGAAPDSLAALEGLGADAEAMRAARALRERVAAFGGLPAVAPPAGLQADLRPYQQRGLDFLAYAAGLEIGALLADDMGLGKTLQALAWLEYLRARDPRGGPSLVVCPTSVIHNWAREAARFTPALRVLLLERGAGRRALFEAVAAHDLVVTNYALLRRDAEAWREVRLRALILDEAQNLKNPDAAVTRVVRSLTARHRLALTGTPLENRALDLWSLVECVNPGYLGARARFAERFDRLDAPPHARRLLAAKLRPILLRRTKAEVAADLPARIEERIDCELSREQRLLYVDALRRGRALVEGLGAQRQDLARSRLHILAALTRLRQICCHPALAGGKATLPSGKFDALFELVEPLLAEGHKVLVFSQFVACLRLLDKALAARGVPTHSLTGASVKREHIVDAFQHDARPGVFLVSLKAGGTGLNLTAASYVVLFDPWWNPAVEAQAIDRTHRIGQHRTVIAYRLIARETIEEKIFALQQQKAALARDVLGEDGFARALTRDDLGYLFAET